jgi:hypothetical protein
MEDAIFTNFPRDPKTGALLSLPKLNEPVRFAVGHPDGLTSNSWRVWATKSGVYLACRDNAQDIKVSLHTGGRWRIGFTDEAVRKRPNLVAKDANRAWEVWGEPPATLPSGGVVAFKLVFVTSELAVPPDQRAHNLWRSTFIVEPGPPGSMTMATLFVTDGAPVLQPQDGLAFSPGLFALEGGRFARLVLHREPEATFRPMMEGAVLAARAQAEEAGVAIPSTSFAYLIGRQEDGCRFLFGARVPRP